MSISQVGQIAVWALIGLLALILLGAVRNFFAVKVINNGIFAALAAPFIIVSAGFQFLIAGISHLVNWMHGTLSNSSDVNFWDIAGPLMYFLFLAVLVAGDAYLAVITFPELFGSKPPDINPALLLPMTAVLWVTIFLTIAGVAADLFGITRFLRPYSEATGNVQRWLRIAALISLALLGIAATLLGIFRTLLASFITIGVLNGLLDVVFFVLITAAGMAAGVAILYGALALIVFVASLMKIVARTVTFALSVPINILDKLSELIVGLYDVPARIGLVVWNWISQLSDGHKWQLGKIPQFEVRPHISDQIRLPRP